MMLTVPTPRPATATSRAVDDVLHSIVLDALRPSSSRPATAMSGRAPSASSSGSVWDVVQDLVDDAARPPTASTADDNCAAQLCTVMVHTDAAPQHAGSDITLALASYTNPGPSSAPAAGDVPAASWLGFTTPAARGGTWPGVAPAVLQKLALVPRNPNAEPLSDQPTLVAADVTDASATTSASSDQALLALPADHPVLAQAQQELARQLRVMQGTLQREFRCMAKERQTAARRREQQGLALYHHQQHLARLQQQTAATESACLAAAKDRRAAEEQAAAMQRDVEAAAAACSRDAAQLTVLEGQAQRLATTALQLAEEVETASSRVAVTRRSTYAADTAASQLEHAKRRQDLLLVALQDRREALEAAMSDIDAQVAARVAAAEAARAMLSATQSDVDAALAEKRKLSTTISGTLRTLQYRDAALQEAARATEAHQLTCQEQRRQLRVLLSQQQQQQAEVSVVEALAARLASDAEATQGALQQQEAALASCRATQDETRLVTAALDEEAAGLGRQVAQAQRAQRAFQEQRAHLQQTHRSLQQQHTAAIAKRLQHQRGASQHLQQLRSTQEAVQAEEATAARLEADAASVAEQTAIAQAQQRELQTRCAEAQAALAAAGEALQEEEARLEAAVADMSARTHALDAANRRLQQLTVGMVAEDTSPQQAALRSLGKALHALAVGNAGLLRRLVKEQQQLVKLQGQGDELAATLERHQDAQRVLQHKRQRLAQRETTQQVTHKRLQRCTNALHATAARLGAQQACAAEQLAPAQTALTAQQSTAKQQLAVLAAQEKALQRALEEARAALGAQEAALGAAEDAVRQEEQRAAELAALQDAVRHGDEQQQVAAAQREIAALQGQLGTVRARRHKLLTAVQRAVVQRDTVMIKGRATKQQDGNQAVQAKQRRAAALLERAVRERRTQLKEAEGALQDAQQLKQHRAERLAALRETIDHCRLQQQELQQATQDAMHARRKAMLATSAMQQAAQHYRQAVEGALKAPAGCQEALLAAQARHAALAQVRMLPGTRPASVMQPQVVDTLAVRVQPAGQPVMEHVLVARAHVDAHQQLVDVCLKSGS